METVLKTGYRKILELFYNNKHHNIHLREIARRTGLNANSATRFLNQLEKRQTLISKKEANLKKYTINRQKNVFAIFSLFDIKAFNKLPDIRKKSINYFLQKLREKPVIAILFGSTAKGNFTPQSDIDLLLIVNKKIKTENSEEYTEAQMGISINCIQIEYNTFIRELKLKQDKVIQSALHSGYPLSNHLLYYKITLDEN